eukprot:PhM_4_TR682/c0_g1_i2/m.41117
MLPSDSRMIQQIFDLAFIVLPTAGYWSQLFAIRSSRSAEGFSVQISLIILTALLLRVAFWFVKGFSTVLLYQALVMIVMQVVLIFEVTSIKAKYTCELPVLHNFMDKNQLNTFNGTLKMIFLFSITTAVACGVLGPFPLFQESIGVMSLFIESLLVSPQIARNYARNSTEGLDLMLVFTWTFGDLWKLGYSIVQAYPMQFIACAIMQITLDIVVMIQIKTLPNTAPMHEIGER